MNLNNYIKNYPKSFISHLINKRYWSFLYLYFALFIGFVYFGVSYLFLVALCLETALMPKLLYLVGFWFIVENSLYFIESALFGGK